jgi:DNA-binding response OmpR family regulator
MRNHCPRCEDHEAEIAYLRSELGLVVDLHAANHLRKAAGIGLCEAKIVLHLRHCAHHTTTRLQLDDHLRESNSGNAIDTHICKIRKVLGHDAFEPIKGHGYTLTPAGVARVDALMGEQPVAQES